MLAKCQEAERIELERRWGPMVSGKELENQISLMQTNTDTDWYLTQPEHAE